jgi:hypothetical protein
VAKPEGKKQVARLSVNGKEVVKQIIRSRMKGRGMD